MVSPTSPDETNLPPNTNIYQYTHCAEVVDRLSNEMVNVTLGPIKASNWKDCIDLQPAPEQMDWVPSNLYSIAEAQFYPEARSRAIYNQEDQLVGYALYGRDVSTGKWKIFRLMIDHAFQGRGYGKAALNQIITDISQRPDGDEILICYWDTNQAARKLYAQLGFVEQHNDLLGKVTALWTRKGKR